MFERFEGLRRAGCLLGFLAVSLCGLGVQAEETHAEAIVADILKEVAKIRAADPRAEPIAFWDFDGTVVKGDISTELVYPMPMHEKIKYSGVS